MQSFVGRFLQVHTVTMCYGGDLRRQGREAVEAILNEFRDVAAARDALLPRLAIVLFTQPDSDPDGTKQVSESLERLRVGIEEGLGNAGVEFPAVPTIGCSVASITDIETRQVYKRAFSVTVLAARQRDFVARVGASRGFGDDPEKAWEACQQVIENQPTPVEPAASFVIAFFPGMVRNAKSHTSLRELKLELPIYGAGAGPKGGAYVIGGGELIENGYVCANVHTTLHFRATMDNNLKIYDDTLEIAEFKDDTHKAIKLLRYKATGQPITPQELSERIRERFALHAVNLSNFTESFVSVVLKPDGTLELSEPLPPDVSIRLVVTDKEKPVFTEIGIKRLMEDAPVGFCLFLSCFGAHRLLGQNEEEREEAVLQQLQRMAIHPRTTPYNMASGLVFGEWGRTPDLNSHARYYHTTTLAIGDGLIQRYHRSRQLETIERCSRDMSGMLLQAEEAAKQRLTTREAAKVLSEALLSAIADLGYDGGLVSVVEEAEQNIVGVAAQGPKWKRLMERAVVHFDEQTLLAEVYRSNTDKPFHIPNCKADQRCMREAAEKIASQTVIPLFDGSRCLGMIQVGHAAIRNELPDHERNALSAFARTAAFHLSRIKSQETIRSLEEAVRTAIATENQEEGWCRLAATMARALDVQFCLIRLRDRSGSFLKLVGGTRELFELTREDRPYTEIRSGGGPVAEWFRQQETRAAFAEIDPFVSNEATNDKHILSIIDASPTLAPLYGRIRSYLLGPIVLANTNLVGVISFLSFRRDFFNPKRVELARKIADFVSIVAGTYRSTAAAQTVLDVMAALTVVQTKVDDILRAPVDLEQDSQAAADLLVGEMVRIFPCEAVTLHRFEDRIDKDNGADKAVRHCLTLYAAAPNPNIHDKREWDVLKRQDKGLLLHLATLSEPFSAAGSVLRTNPYIRVTSGVWKWLPKTNKLHSILAIPLASPDGRQFGLLTLFNRLNEQGWPHDSVDFFDVPQHVRMALEEIATYVLETLDSRGRMARLSELAVQLHKEAESYTRGANPEKSEVVLSRMAEMMAKALGGDLCSIYAASRPEGDMVLVGCSGWHVGDQMINKASYKVGEGLTGALALADGPIVVPSVSADTRRSRKYFRAMYGEEDPQLTHEMIALPLPRDGRGRPTGIVTVLRELPTEYAQLLSFRNNDNVLDLASRLTAFAVTAVISDPDLQDGAAERRVPAIADILNVVAREPLPMLDYSELAGRIRDHFDAALCGIFLPVSHEQDAIWLSGASDKWARYVGKIQIVKNEGPVGRAFGAIATQFRDRFDSRWSTGQLDSPLREALNGPATNLMAVPMFLGEDCGGVILLVDQTVFPHDSRARELRRYSLEALGTCILLLQREIEHRDAVTPRAQSEAIRSATAELVHEAKTYIHEIGGWVESLRRASTSESEKSERLDWIRDTFGTFAERVQDIMETLREGDPSEVVEVAETIDRAVRQRENHARSEKVRIENEVRGSLYVRAPRIRLISVWSQLLENAIDACKSIDGATVWIRNETVDPSQVRISIVDNGIGVAEEHLPWLFVRNYSTKDSRRGVRRGHGLTMAKIILLEHGGELHIRNEPDGGARATVWLQGVDHA